MARIRTIKPEFWSHAVLGRAQDSTKLLAIALLNYADDDGYFLADPILVRNFARPFDEDSRKTTGALQELSKAGFIEVRETPSGKGPVGKIVNFSEHQVISHKGNSRLKLAFDSSNPPGVLQEDSLPDLGSRNREQGTGNREVEKGSCSEPPAASEPEPGDEVIYRIPCTGTGPKAWPLTQRKVDEWAQSFPGVDVKAELRKAIQWLRDNPTKAKTYAGMSRFLGTWLGKAQDAPRRAPIPLANQQNREPGRKVRPEHLEQILATYGGGN